MGSVGIALVICGIVALISLVWLAIVKYLRQKYDAVLEEETEREITPADAVEYDDLVTIIPETDLPRTRPTTFMPVPNEVGDTIDFITREKDGIDIRSCITVADADRLMTDEETSLLVGTLYQEHPRGRQYHAVVYLDDLSSRFSPYSFINLHILKQLGLIPRSSSTLEVVARGVLRKPLMIVANTFSPTAIKMLSLTGGRACLLKDLS
jgi:hypothetical protein